MKKSKKLLAASVAGAMLLPAAASAAEIKVGVLLGFTGPIESLTPEMGNSAELAFKEASDSGLLLGGDTLSVVRGDSTCVDAAAATAAAERLITSDNVAAIVGAACSGVTIATVNNVGVPNGVTMISPSATSPALTTVEDNGLFFRTAPSDARQGQLLAEIVRERGVSSVAVTFTNNDYGKGLAESFGGAFKALGGTIEIEAPHEDGKADYAAEVGALAASGADNLVVFGYVDQGGKGIVQASLDTGAFDSFIFADGMVGDLDVDGDVSGSFGTRPGGVSDGFSAYVALAAAAGIDGESGPFRGESYDAAALIALAMQAAGSSDRAGIAANILKVANAPGEPIGPGEIAKGLQILADGGEINYQGATGVEFNDIGEVAGTYLELEIDGDDFNTIEVHQ
jgi:branched-chain amino acid transport system substrate-binding protein